MLTTDLIIAAISNIELQTRGCFKLILRYEFRDVPFKCNVG
jgi:hypothetical protein